MSDTWMGWLDFIQQTGGDLNKFVDDGAWNSHIDNFVAMMQTKK